MARVLIGIIAPLARDGSIPPAKPIYRDLPDNPDNRDSPSSEPVREENPQDDIADTLAVIFQRQIKELRKINRSVKE
ncbi:MAG: hypothetical protein ACI4RV_01350 [Eubacteriales bacterium]